MKINLFAKLATISTVVLFAIGCQKSVITDGTESGKRATTPRSVTYNQYNVSGFGYDITGRYSNEKSAKGPVIDPRKVKAAGRLQDTEPSGTDSWEEYGENASSYSQKMSRRVNAGAGFKIFGIELSASFSRLDTSSNYFDAKYIYSTYYFTVTKRSINMNGTAATLMPHLDDNFKSDVLTYTPQELVRFYGTHVMTHIYTGGRLNISYQAETRHSNRTAAARAGAKVTASKFNVEVGTSSDVSETDASHNYNRTLAYSTIGGDTRHQLVGEINLEITNTVFNKTNWQNSITKENSKLIDFGSDGLVPIYEFISDPNKKQQVKKYVEDYVRNKEIQNLYKRVPVHSKYFRGNRNTNENHILDLDPNIAGTHLEYHGIAFYAFDYQAPNTVPVYRYYHQRWNDHFYTTNPAAERLEGYNYELIAFYAYKSPTQTNGTPTVPVYRFMNTPTFNHFYSRVRGPHATGYNYEKIEFYAHNE
ncbi:MAC/perforin domain-containing protein [Sphingobacterium sp. lm-10]|uniref:MAC/perforin domain-containing protein n=1 Tax=Sphingobacterium sp. lm-10 TaxID=2944904 RepID=UPI0020200E99|nr:MAC/perforin domain-containing protein [Sphingobacterium sp. lm-10]MCL7987687.1 MAC/perforin domain-containing protein [Sphingobacterium sp. lm-10]